MVKKFFKEYKQEVDNHFEYENQTVFPELFGPNFNEKSIYEKGMEFMLSECLRSTCIKKCSYLKKSLGSKNASEESAKTILKLI